MDRSPHSLLCVGMLKWLYGRSTGKVESTISELYGTFQRNGFVPIGLKSILLDMEKNKSIKDRQIAKGFCLENC